MIIKNIRKNLFQNDSILKEKMINLTNSFL